MRFVTLCAAGAATAALVVAGTGCVEPGANTLTGVTVSNRQTVDTVSFTFFDTLPGDAHATFTGTTLPRGSGGSENPVQCDGKTFVGVVLHSAIAHDQRGRGTAQGAVYAKNLNSVAEVCMVEDFEGYVQYAIGLNTTKAPKLLVTRVDNVIRVVITRT